MLLDKIRKCIPQPAIRGNIPRWWLPSTWSWWPSWWASTIDSEAGRFSSSGPSPPSAPWRRTRPWTRRRRPGWGWTSALPRERRPTARLLEGKRLGLRFEILLYLELLSTEYHLSSCACPQIFGVKYNSFPICHDISLVKFPVLVYAISWWRTALRPIYGSEVSLIA